jgi:hypothetical protein
MPNITKRLVVLGALTALMMPQRASAQDHGRLTPLSYLAGTWIGRTEGSGPQIHVETRFFWGPTGRVLHFETYDLSEAKRELLYEGHVQCDPKESGCQQFNIKPNGDLTRFEVQVDSSGFVAIGTNTRSVIKRTSEDSMEWHLRANVNGEWRDIMTAVYRRVPRSP